VKITRAGYAPLTLLEGSGALPQPGARAATELSFRLRRASDVPSGMVTVAGGPALVSSYPNGPLRAASVDDFLIDAHEVTNEEYKRFVEAGGYRRSEYWNKPFVDGRRTISWAEAMTRLIDSTGRPGPATWEAGTYPDGAARRPVGGISWYEAAAYAEFAQKTLPTAFHWARAAQLQSPVAAATVAAAGNFDATGPHDVGNPAALSGYGTTDMAGNVKEWCANDAGDGRRFILGGGFGEQKYMFMEVDVQSPWERRPNFGVRTMKLDAPASADLLAPIALRTRDFSKEAPISDSAFEVARGVYDYDHTALNARVGSTALIQGWEHETVSFDAAYGQERVIAHVFLPRSRGAPFQPVIYFPGGFAAQDATLDLSVLLGSLDFVLKSGRALIVPIYKTTYERRSSVQAIPGGTPPALFRDELIMVAKDLRRSIDYLETRGDMDATKIGYFGFSMGAQFAPVFLAIEPRIKAAILDSGGFVLRRDLPEVDRLNFAPHVHTPVLMLNGRFDMSFPLETAQRPMFERLGTARVDKKHVLYDAGHGTVPHGERVRQTLDWLDKYLGPIQLQ